MTIGKLILIGDIIEYGHTEKFISVVIGYRNTIPCVIMGKVVVKITYLANVRRIK